MCNHVTLVTLEFKRTFVNGTLQGITIDVTLCRIPKDTARQMVKKCKRENGILNTGIFGTSDSVLSDMRIVE